MSKYKPRKPNPDVEYTFLFPSGRRFTLRFIGENENGALIFFNVTTKERCKKPITARRFDYMLDHNLVWSKKVETPLKMNSKLSRKDKMNLRAIKSLTEDEKAHVNSKLAYTVDELVLRYRKAINDNDKDKIGCYRLICDSIVNMLKTAN